MDATSGTEHAPKSDVDQFPWHFPKIDPCRGFQMVAGTPTGAGYFENPKPRWENLATRDDHQHLAHDGAAHDRPVASGRPMHVQITLNSRVGDRLRAEARDRNVEPQSLIETMMGIVADDNLFAAIMDK